jgi:hypothetical protein
MKKQALIPFFFLAFALGPQALLSKAAQDIPRIDSPPEIDGKMDDAVWATAFKMSDFKTFEPAYDKDPHEKTEGYMVYDAENFYFAIRAYDKKPNAIKASMAKRDNMFEDDWVGVIIDTFNDRQSGYGFLVNPLGIQGDGIMNVQGNLDESYDMVWYSKGIIDDQGYTVEFRVPLKSIRFPGKEKIIMRIIFVRQLIRYSEMATSPALDPENGGIITQCQPISVHNLKYKRVLEFLPAVTHSQEKAVDEGRLKPDEKFTDLSMTAKVGLTSDLILDATVNPDFSQVEADAGQVDINLRYDLFFPEKRPFFLEGNEIFQFAGNTEDAPLWMVMHTRKIVNPMYGVKLTGKLGSRNTVAGIYTKDQIEEDEEMVRPDFSIFRIKHALKEDSYIGGFYTGKTQEEGHNLVFGSDGRIRLTNRSIAEYHFFGSFTRDPEDDSRKRGHALAIKYSYESRNMILIFGLQDISRDFHIATGFITRKDITRLAAFSMYRFYPDSTFFKRIEPFYWSFHIHDKESGMFETFNLFTLRFLFPRNTSFRVDTILANEIFQGQRFNRSGVGIQANSQITKHLNFWLWYRCGGSIYYDEDDPYQGYGNRGGGGLDFQPLEKLNSYFSLSYSDFYRSSDQEKIYDYVLLRNRTTFQVNKYLFFRGITEYNTYWEKLTVDFLASFTYIPGTVIHLGYGSVFEKIAWEKDDYVDSHSFLETRRGFFFKVSYLMRF